MSGTPGLPQVSAAPAPAPASTPPIAFGRRDGLFRLVVKNTLLTLVTLGIYRFWARAAIRRFYWGNVAIAGERLEYTGTGAELFVGFLVAIMLLAPLFGTFTVIRLLTDPESIWFAVETAAYGATIYVFVAAAQFRARRYRLSRTRWRGVRFAQDGSTWRYIGLTLGWTALVVATAGIGFPWLRWAQQRYLMRCTSFGDRRFAFDGGPRALVWRWLLVLALFVLPVVAMAIQGAGMVETAVEAGVDGDEGTEAPPPIDPAVRAKLARQGGIAGGLLFFALVFGGIAFVVYRVAEMRVFAGATRLGAIAVRSGARAGRVAGAMLKGLGLFVAWIVLAGILVFLLAGLLFMLSDRNEAVWLFGGLIWVALALLGASLIMELVVRFGILRHVVTTLELTNVETLADIAQSTGATPRTGEGLADAFDLGPL